MRGRPRAPNSKDSRKKNLRNLQSLKNVGTIVRANHIRDDIVADQSDEKTNTINIDQSVCIIHRIISNDNRALRTNHIRGDEEVDQSVKK